MSGRKLIDEFSHLEGTVSRQRITQLRHKRDGLCMVCSRPLKTALHCEVHERTMHQRRKARELKAAAAKQVKAKSERATNKIERQLEEALKKLTPEQKVQSEWFIRARVKRGIRVSTLTRLDAALAAAL